jgi:hypothetical protein
MIRTTVTLPEPLHQRLLLTSRAVGKPISALIQDAVTSVLTQQEEAQRDQVFHALDQVRGIADAADPTISSTINETLYGT